MRLLAVIVFFSFSTLTNAQNLVPNPGFENYTVCPNGASQIDYAIPWTGTNNSSDYYNSCSSNLSSTVPQNMFTFYLYPHSGNAFSAIWAYNGPSNYREYLKVLLSDTLENSVCYWVEFYTLVANVCDFTTKNLSLSFSVDTTSSTGTGLVLNLPQHITSISYIEDTISWKRIAGIYTANGNERAITIGNFLNDSLTDTNYVHYGNYYGIYFFIDDVSVIPIDSIPGGLPAFAGNDTLIMQGDSLFIGQEISNLNCNWYDEDGTLIASGISGIFVQPDSTTFYVVEQNLCGNVSYDTVVVSVSPVGVEEFEIKNLKFEIYPNPAKEKLFIETDIVNGTLQITDVTGKIIKEIKLTQPKTEIQAELLSNGTYFVSIMSEKKIFKTKRIVIAK